MVYKAFGTFPSLGSRYPHFLIRFFKRPFSKHLAQLHDFGVFREAASFDKGDHEQSARHSEGCSRSADFSVNARSDLPILPIEGAIHADS